MDFHKQILFTGCPDHLALLDYVSSPQFGTFNTFQLLVMVSCKNISTSYSIHITHSSHSSPKFIQKIFIHPSLLHWAKPPPTEGLVTSLNKSDTREKPHSDSSYLGDDQTKPTDGPTVCGLTYHSSVTISAQVWTNWLCLEWRSTARPGHPVCPFSNVTCQCGYLYYLPIALPR